MIQFLLEMPMNGSFYLSLVEVVSSSISYLASRVGLACYADAYERVSCMTMGLSICYCIFYSLEVSPDECSMLNGLK